jgi:putative transposase
LRHLDANIPVALQLHVIADNHATHKHSKVKAWLASHPRFHLHFTPTYSSWLKQIERWFALITQQAIRRGYFRSVRELVGKIDATSLITMPTTLRLDCHRRLDIRQTPAYL